MGLTPAKTYSIPEGGLGVPAAAASTALGIAADSVATGSFVRW